ncbi:hypothetical protein [Natronosalvus halobius]|uniref:hypothetical protein n=1 Tax=Natronosalvus halobius TaxID=2953746 RepID=UPI0020A1967B|nr:hypothetical protein [Natronosalvus halobius]USZ72200.1 hypothetical protein NGM15_02495 [Natronosalvus halobius]
MVVIIIAIAIEELESWTLLRRCRREATQRASVEKNSSIEKSAGREKRGTGVRRVGDGR